MNEPKEPANYPETLEEFEARMKTGEPSPIKDVRFPPGDPRRYGAQPDNSTAEP